MYREANIGRCGWIPVTARFCFATTMMAILGLASVKAISSPVVNGDIRLLEPKSLQLTALQTFSLETVNYTGPVTILIDGVDVSASAKRNNTRLVYRTAEPLPPGKHQLTVLTTAVGGPGRSEWQLVVNEPRRTAHQRELYSKSSLSLSASYVSGDKINNDQTVASGNLAVDVGARVDQTNVSLETNIGYSSTSSNNDLTPTGYLLQAKQEQDRLALGDVSFTGTPLTVPSLAHRGAMADMHWGAFDLQLMQVNSRSITGWSTGLGSDNQLQGAVLGYAGSSADGQMPKLTAVVLSGEIQDASSYNVASIDPPSRGKVLGVQGSGQYAGFGYTAELGFSEFDQNTKDTVAAKHDLAGSIQLNKVVGGIGLSAAYQRAGADYSSIANPGATFDREQLGMSASTAFDISSVSLSLGRSRDNLDNDPSRPVVYNDNIGLSYALTPQSWPALSFSYSVGTVKSDAEPVGTPTTDISTQNASASMSLNRQQWMGSVVVNAGLIDDPVNGGTGSGSAVLTLQVQPDKYWSLVPSMSLIRSRHQAVTQETVLATMSLNWKISKTIGAAGQGAWVRNIADDDSVDNLQINPVLRVSWDITDYLKRLLSQQHAGLTLSYRGNHYRDHIDSSNSLTDQSVLLGIDISAPLEGRYGY
jgi:hypothetical protein